MSKQKKNARFAEGQFNTLAQSRNDQDTLFPSLPEIEVRGKGTDCSKPDDLQKRAKRKMTTDALVLALVDVAKELGDTKMARSYWNAYHCQRKLYQHEDKLYGHYCKSRFCTLCNSIRKAEKINKYLPILNTWEEPYFTTLTAKSVTAEELPARVEKMIANFKLIKDRCRKRGIKLIGIKSLECNFNPKEQTYNPHFHLILPDKASYMIWMKEWRLQWNDPKIVSKGAQYTKKILDTKKHMVEVVKYSTKVFTDYDKRNKKSKKIPPKIYAVAMHNIYCAFKGRRLFDRFGFNLPKASSKPKSQKKEITNYTQLEFDSKTNDWVNLDTGEVLTGYSPTPTLSHLLHNIDTDLE